MEAGHLLQLIHLVAVKVDALFQKSLQRAIPDLSRLRSDPAAMLARGDIRIGPVRKYAAATSAAALSAVLFWWLIVVPNRPLLFPKGIPVLESTLITVAAVVMSIPLIVRLFPGGQCLLTKNGVELKFKRSVVFCPWSLFNASGTLLAIAEHGQQAVVVLPLSPPAVGLVEAREDGFVIAQGRQVNTRQFKFRSDGEAELFGLYVVQAAELAGLLLELGRTLGKALPGQPVSSAEAPGGGRQTPSAVASDANSSIAVSLTRDPWPWKTFWIVFLLTLAMGGGSGYLFGTVLWIVQRGIERAFPDACAFTAVFFSLPVAWYLGKRAVRKKWYAGPIAKYTEAIQLDPKDVSAWYNRGLAYTMRGDHRQAIADWDEIIRLVPTHPEAYVNRVNSFGAMGQFKRVIAEYSAVIQNDPRNPLAYCARATACNGSGQFEQSIPDATEAIRLDPQLYLGYDARGFGCLQRGFRTGRKADYEQSYADFTEALRLKPTAEDCQHGRAMAYQGLQRARK